MKAILQIWAITLAILAIVSISQKEIHVVLETTGDTYAVVLTNGNAIILDDGK